MNYKYNEIQCEITFSLEKKKKIVLLKLKVFSKLLINYCDLH